MVAGRPGRGVQIAAEFYNVFNITQWTAVDTVARFDRQGNQVNARFGQVTAAADPRIVQLSLRAMF
jgi:outer membrane receptor protein involved in Fe transport